MSYTSRFTVKNFYSLVNSGWEPTFREIKEKYYSNYNRTNPLDVMRQDKLTRLLISRVRRQFKKENPPRFFYEVAGIYKLLSSSGDSLDVVNNLVKLTNGFQRASMSLIDDTAQKYPQLTSRFLYRLQAAFEQIGMLATSAIKSLESGLQEYETESKSDQT